MSCSATIRPPSGSQPGQLSVSGRAGSRRGHAPTVAFLTPADAREEALAGLLAEAGVEIVALAAARRGAQHGAGTEAERAIQILLPLHVLGVAHGERAEVAHHQRAQLGARPQAQVLPQMIGP